MPNQNPTQNQTNETSTLPDFMNQETAATPQTSLPIPEIDNLTNPIAPPKKKFGGGRMIATILGVLLMIGGVGAGIILTQQQQLFNQKAEGTTYPGTYPVYENGGSSGKIVGYRYIAVPGVFEAALQRAASGNSFDLSLLTGYYGMTTEQINDASSHLANGETWVPSGTGCNDTPESKTPGNPHYCLDWHWTNCLHPGTGIGGVGCDVISNPTNPPVDIPTPPPPSGPTAVCSNIKAYNSSWVSLTNADLSVLAPGTSINFCVTGTTDSGSFDKAQFTITHDVSELSNAEIFPETTTKRPNSSDFCQAYTIPSGAKSVKAEAKIHHATLGWK